jgi:hypothetical protein
VLFAYIDESGNTGPVSNRGSLTYTLGCVLLNDSNWPSAFDGFINFRRQLKDKFGVPVRTELKANWLIRNSGPLRDLRLSDRERHVIYRAHLRMLKPLGTRAFSVVIDKRENERSNHEVFELAWTTLLQRLERTSYYETQPLMILHDEGEDAQVRKLVRKSRRHLTSGSAWGLGSLRNPFKLLVEDSVSRHSDQNLWIQMADLVAYAGFRSVIPPSKAIAVICPAEMWSEIGESRHVAVNRIGGGTPAIVHRR